MKLLGGLEFLRFLVVYHLVFIIAVPTSFKKSSTLL